MGQIVWKIMLPDVLHCRFVLRCARKILKVYSESPFPCASNDTKFKAYSELSNCHLKTPKRLVRMIISALETAWIVFSDLNDDCLAQGRPRELRTGIITTAWKGEF